MSFFKTHFIYRFSRFILLMGLSAGQLCFISASQANDSCRDLAQKKCVTCHFETRICQKIQKNKGKVSWKRTIKSMIRHGAQLNAKEQKILITCFSGPDSSILSFCRMDK